MHDVSKVLWFIYWCSVPIALWHSCHLSGITNGISSKILDLKGVLADLSHLLEDGLYIAKTDRFLKYFHRV
eukprot:4202022-Ditylum_brightwellii.AAC.1